MIGVNGGLLNFLYEVADGIERARAKDFARRQHARDYRQVGQHECRGAASIHANEWNRGGRWSDAGAGERFPFGVGSQAVCM